MMIALLQPMGNKQRRKNEIGNERPKIMDLQS
ncbi:unnamed protein product [Strongylus vulgaris]|uniref:Uncharacterized protein n=1 Tax=Strongylus vulgaris TaxID=40348 RepID=A0A3P7J473_STRVU|nr:unnamed protein product [Strongylus vulgaris]